MGKASPINSTKTLRERLIQYLKTNVYVIMIMDRTGARPARGFTFTVHIDTPQPRVYNDSPVSDATMYWVYSDISVFLRFHFTVYFKVDVPPFFHFAKTSIYD
jgi:hypothetical protein